MEYMVTHTLEVVEISIVRTRLCGLVESEPRTNCVNH
jgi:hypothetical protein